MSRREQLTSRDVIELLRKGPLARPAHALLSEVRNQTGYSRRVRSADALAVSLWPSRGIWFAGIEVKVFRNDWLRELKQPDKSTEIQQFCDYWWIAAPSGIVKIEEVPETWGLYEIEGKKVKVTRPAPKLSPLPLTQEFVASVFRNQADQLDGARMAGHALGYAEAEQKLSADKLAELEGKLVTVQRELDVVKRQLEFKEGDLAHLRSAVDEFERSIGMPQHTIGVRSYQRSLEHQREATEIYQLAERLWRLDKGPVVAMLEAALASARQVRDLVKPQENGSIQKIGGADLDHGEEAAV